MGASQSYNGNAVNENEDKPILDLPSRPKDNDVMLDLNIDNMKKRACSVDPKLSANPKRRAPPINPKTCKEGSIAMGKDSEFYVIKSGRWAKVSKSLAREKKEMIKQKLNNTPSMRKRMSAKKVKAAQTPKRRRTKSVSKKGPGRPKGSKNKKSAKTPKRK